jgi:uncharacterized protein (DUF1810 family)
MARADDPFDLDRFVAAQDDRGTYETALAELRDGRKRSHWMWFVFPQVAGLGRSPAARRYAVAGVDEARAYVAHPTLGPRLLACVDALLATTGATAEDVLGGIDAVKLRSSMTLFARAAPDEPRFAEVLERYYDGRADDATDDLLRPA